jgi:hypothetical protein
MTADYATREAGARAAVQQILASLEGPQRPLDSRDASAEVDGPEPEFASPAECDMAADREFSQRMGWGR